MSAPARAALAAVGALALVGSWPARVGLADFEAELDGLRRAIRESRTLVAAYEREQRGLLETIEALDRSAALLAEQVARERRNAERARAELAAVQAEQEELSERLARTERAMARRAVGLYQAGELGALPMLFSAGGLREFLSRVQTLRLLLEHDAELLARHRAESDAMAAARSRAREAAARHEAAAARLRERSRELAAEREARRALVERLYEDRARERAALAELETAARALEETISTLERAPRRGAPPIGGPPFATLRGWLAPPVAAPIAVGFGRHVDTEFLTETFRSGVEFAAALGSPVRAVAAGHVRFAGWFRGYGRLVILDHGDQHFTVSGHLAGIEVEVGQRVEAGDVIGSVGDTGSLSGPRLYFEIRHGGEPLDPRDWIRAAEAR